MKTSNNILPSFLTENKHSEKLEKLLKATGIKWSKRGWIYGKYGGVYLTKQKLNEIGVPMAAIRDIFSVRTKGEKVFFGFSGVPSKML